MEKSLKIANPFNDKNASILFNNGKYICILAALGLSYSIINKLIDNDYNFKIDTNKNSPKIEIYK